MEILSEFCNICYKTNDGNVNNISVENMQHLKDTLITFVGHADIINNDIIYLCQLCCQELMRFNKFKEMCFNNLIQPRQRVIDMKSKFRLGRRKSEEEFNVKNEVESRTTEEFGVQVTVDVVESGLNNGEECFNSGIESTKQELCVKQEDNIAEDRSAAATNNPRPSSLRLLERRKKKRQRTLQSVANPGDEQHTCTLCNEKFRTSSHLASHSHIHSGDRPYECTVCNMAFAQSSNLTKHERIHSGDRPYMCTVCGKAFTQKSNLTVHGRTHSGDRPYKCTVCDKTFTQACTLTIHERIHSGHRPYKCNFCKKAFTDPSSLTRHERIHTGDRPYKCTVCNKAFTQSPDLNGHIQNVHSNKL